MDLLEPSSHSWGGQGTGAAWPQKTSGNPRNWALCPTLGAAFYRTIFFPVLLIPFVCVLGFFFLQFPFPPSLFCGFLAGMAGEGCVSVDSDDTYS